MPNFFSNLFSNKEIVVKNSQPDDLEKQTSNLMARIGGAESGGRYNIRVSTGKKGQFALGKYGIVNTFLQDYARVAGIKRKISEQEFLSNPKLQDQIAQANIRENIRKHGVVGATNKWLTGSPNPDPNVKDRFGTTPAKYQQMVLGGSGKFSLPQPTSKKKFDTKNLTSDNFFSSGPAQSSQSFTPEVEQSGQRTATGVKNFFSGAADVAETFVKKVSEFTSGERLRDDPFAIRMSNLSDSFIKRAAPGLAALQESARTGSIDPFKTSLRESFQKFSEQSPQDLAMSFGPHGAAGSIKTAGDDLVRVARDQGDDLVKQFVQVLKEAKPIRAAQEKLYSAERAKKLARVMAVRSKEGGEAGFYKELGQLKGDLPKVQFESLRSKITQEQIDALFNKVRDSELLGNFDKINAREGLAKIFNKIGGQVPTNSELKLLSRVFPKEVIDELMAKRPLWEKAKEGLLKAINLPRSIVSSIDMSAPFRQGVFFVGRKEFYKAIPKMIKQFASEESFREVQQEIIRRPTYDLMRRSKLALTDIDDFLLDREEAFLSNWAEIPFKALQKIPGVGRLVPNPIRASNRAYTGFLNKIRADVFDNMVKNAKSVGIEPDEIADNLSRFINAATGRGSIKMLEKSVNLMQGVFFSPRLIMSRLNLLNPQFYASLDPFTRKQALKSLFSFTAIGTTVASLAKAGGASVELDPRNADFGKVKIGNTRIDIWGGFQQYARLASQLMSGKIISSTTGKELQLGEGYKPITRLGITARFFRGKFNPLASFITDWLEGQNVIGEKFEAKKEFAELFVPLIIQDVKETIKDQGWAKGVGLSLPAIFGFGVQTYPDQPKGRKPSGLPKLPRKPSLPKLPTQ